MDKRNIKEAVDKIWPKSKKELEKGINEAKRLIDKGEKHLIDATDKGMRNVKAMALQLKREKLYYELGKLVANVSAKKWSGTKKIDQTLKEIKKIDKGIKTIKKSTEKKASS